MSEKSSKPKNRIESEEQYFAEQEQKKRAALREKLNQERETKKHDHKTSEHWMKCPKCGGELVELGFEDVMIDKCKGCRGIFFDAGELELLIGGGKSKGFLEKFMESLGA